jgi:hypothetical protein
MKTRVKVGDLAYLVKAYNKENIGVVVEVMQAFGDCDDGLGFRWVCQTTTSIKVSDADRTIIGTSTVFTCPDSWLRPIAGPSLEDIIDKEKITNL